MQKTGIILNDSRKREISELAEFIALEHTREFPLYPAAIAKNEGITYSYGLYGECFDGLIQHKAGRFHIYINTQYFSIVSARTRFTFAHELGHYFIDEHRNALKGGCTPSHPSFVEGSIGKNPVEQEADFFASCLLMPEHAVRQFIGKNPLDDTLIENLSRHFGTSIFATIMRYFDLNLFPMAMIFSQEGKIIGVKRTSDFIIRFLPRRGADVPSSTATGEFYELGRKYRDKQIVYFEDWSPRYKRSQQQLYEKCHYLPTGMVVTLLWLKER